MKKSEYHKMIDKLLKSKLIELGFEEVHLKACISYEVLYRKGNLWFGSSWDWRDQYLEINLGNLYWFKDFMPRVIIIGNYSSYSSKINEIPFKGEDYLFKVIEAIKVTINDSISVYNERYEQILSEFLKKQLKYSNGFLNHLGNEVTDSELSELT